jgi:hypothetical protein
MSRLTPADDIQDKITDLKRVIRTGALAFQATYVRALSIVKSDRDNIYAALSPEDNQALQAFACIAKGLLTHPLISGWLRTPLGADPVTPATIKLPGQQ